MVTSSSPSSFSPIRNAKERTEVVYGIDNVINTVLHFLSQTNNKIDACVDYTRPSLAIDFLALKNAFLNAKKRGVKLRYVTEITKDNSSYCKQLLTIMLYELRHLDGIKGNFYISESAYLAPATFHEEGKPASQIIYSNVKEIVEHQRYVFDSFWNRAVPAERRIKEIEEGTSSSSSSVARLHYKTRIIDNSDEIVKEISRLTASSNKLDTCLNSGGLQYSYNHFFHIKKKLLDKQKKGEHKGIRYVTDINNDNAYLAKTYLDHGIHIKHVKNLPSVNFGISDKEIALTIEKMDGGKVPQSLLISNEPLYLKHFSSIFEELWRNGTNAADRIRELEQGIEPAKIEIIDNPRKAVELARNIVRAAKYEVLRIYPSLNAFRRQVRIGALHLFREAVQNGVNVRILIPADRQQIIQVVSEVELALPQIDIRSIDKSLQTHIGIIVADRRDSLIIELRNDTKENYYEAAGLAAYSNSKPIALSYASIFDTLWKQGELYEQVKAYSIAQKEFINIAAHELRTPIQPILGLSEVLHDKIKDTKQIELLDAIIRNAKRLQRLTEDILDVSKIESQSLKLNKERFNLNDVITNIIDEMMINRRESKNEKNDDDDNIKLEYRPKNIFVEADRVRMTQVVSNILSNAIKFTKKGGGSISINTEKEDGHILVSVKDTGTGIDPEISSQLFSKFVTKSYQGTGLGLFISKGIIEAHGGKIWAENNADERGATFSFSLPVSKQQPLSADM
ncbi:MAG TPA: HAMP domain-containing sensor histidine kinase [Nitrososphaeraceae archaeon]|nr:HAMP domain-containing sensor histidine kinase [Nitrososphaeraceae archaeon]